MADRKAAVSAALGFALLAWTMLVIPGHPSDLRLEALLWLPLELPLLIAVLCIVPRRLARPLRWVLVVLMGLSLILRLLDMATATAFQRPFNPYLDRRIAFDGWNLLAGSIGSLPAAVVVAASILAFLALLAVLYRLSGAFQRLRATPRAALLALCVVTSAVGTIWLYRQPEDGRHYVQALEVPSALGRAFEVRQAMRALGTFDQELARDKGRMRGAMPSFAALAGKDVVVVFIESYGRSAVEDPRYAPVVRPRLEAADKELESAGLQAISGWLTSPTVGGLSWLAHGTLLSGLWVDNQVRYDRLVASPQLSLNGLFRAAGWRTVAVMPAITMAWPEARYFGYDRILAAADLGYDGKPFNWVTMPDQYTLSAFERMERQVGPRKPIMTEIALISSHAPWTPLPCLVPWQDIGDGTVFDAQATSGETPRAIWADERLIRRQYLASIDYVLAVLGEWMARFGADTVFVLVGDHQPAPVITGADASRDVPIHVVTADAALLARLGSSGWTPGMLPARETPSLRMDRFRDAFIAAFGQ